MASKVVVPQPVASDLDVLHPERTVVIADKTLTCREYGFIEGMKLRAIAKPFTDSLYEILKAGQFVSVEAMADLVAANIDIIAPLICQAYDIDAGFIAQLNEDDGDKLLMAWWGVNGPFFLRSGQRRIVLEQIQANAVREELLKAAGRMSTNALSATATDPSK